MAGTPAPVIDDQVPGVPERPFCELFENNTLYEGEGWIRSIVHHGRYEGQYLDTVDDYPGGGNEDFWEHRRWRAGLQIDFAGEVRLIHTWNLDTSPDFEGDRFFEEIWDLKLSWNPSDKVELVIGKQRPIITREWDYSSYELLTIERSPLVTNVIPQPLWGVSASYSGDVFRQELGVYGTAFESEYNLPSFEDAGASVLYRLSTPVNDSTVAYFDFMYNDTGTDPGFSETYAAGSYARVASLGTDSRIGRLGLTTNLIAAWDRRDFMLDDTWGIVVMPSYDLTDRLQAVVKATYAEDLRVDRPQRYASRPLVDGYSSLYLGLNYRICGDHFKFMAGYELARGDHIVSTTTPYENQSWVFAVRTMW